MRRDPGRRAGVRHLFAPCGSRRRNADRLAHQRAPPRVAVKPRGAGRAPKYRREPGGPVHGSPRRTRRLGILRHAPCSARPARLRSAGSCAAAAEMPANGSSSTRREWKLSDRASGQVASPGMSPATNPRALGPGSTPASAALRPVIKPARTARRQCPRSCANRAMGPAASLGRPAE